MWHFPPEWLLSQFLQVGRGLPVCYSKTLSVCLSAKDVLFQRHPCLLITTFHASYLKDCSLHTWGFSLVNATCLLSALRIWVLFPIPYVSRLGQVNYHVSRVLMRLDQAAASCCLSRLFLLGCRWQISSSGSHDALLPVSTGTSCLHILPSLVGSGHLSSHSTSVPSLSISYSVFLSFRFSWNAHQWEKTAPQTATIDHSLAWTVWCGWTLIDPHF